MTYMLGSQFCVQSLQNDVNDLQKVLNDVTSRVGHVAAMSWKYPDKLACDLDIEDQLSTHQYNDQNPEDNQIAHIILLELVIDRYNILFHCLTKHLDVTISSLVGKGVNINNQPLKTSIGLVVIKHWNKVVQLQKLIEQVVLEKRVLHRKVRELELESATNSKQSFTPESEAVHINLTEGTKSVAFGTNCKASQTVESVFVSCDSCSGVQKCLRDVSNFVMELCKVHNLPNSLSQYQSQLRELQHFDWISSSDILRWKNELQKDLARLDKYFNQMHALNKQLQMDNLKHLESIKEKTNEIENFDVVRQQDRERERKKMEDLTSKNARLLSQKEDDIKKVTSLNANLKQNVKDLSSQIQSLRVDIDNMKNLVQILDKLRTIFSSDSDEIAYQHMESRANEIKQAVLKLNTMLEEKDEVIKHETLKSASLIKQNQALQSKVQKNANRISELTEQNDDLQEQLHEFEESRDAMAFELRNCSANVVNLEIKLQEQEALVSTLTKAQKNLTTSLHNMESRLKELEDELVVSQENNRLLVEFPDLNGPVNPDLQGTGDIARDMESQFKANQMRIEILQHQNARLRFTVDNIQMKRASSKTNEISNVVDQLPNASESLSQEKPSKTFANKPIPLWSTSEKSTTLPSEPKLFVNINSERCDSVASSNYHPSSPVSAHLTRRSPTKSSLHTAANTTTSSTANLVQWSSRGQPIYPCRKCKKSFKTKTDLTLHANLCYL